MNLKVGIITQARVGSSRLPSKTLLKIAGVTMLEHHLKRLTQSGIPVYLATTSEPNAHQLIDIATKLQIPSTIGPLEDVLARFYECAQFHHLDVVVRVTSDCPLIDGELIAQGLKTFLENPDWKNCYLSNTQQRFFPRGFDFEIFSFALLEKAHQNARESSEREHVTPYIYRNNNSGAKIIHFENIEMKSNKSHYRITVDTPEDFELIQKMILEFGADKFNFKEIISLLDAHPEMVKINQEISQKPH